MWLLVDDDGSNDVRCLLTCEYNSRKEARTHTATCPYEIKIFKPYVNKSELERKYPVIYIGGTIFRAVPREFTVKWKRAYASDRLILVSEIPLVAIWMNQSIIIQFYSLFRFEKVKVDRAWALCSQRGDSRILHDKPTYTGNLTNGQEIGLRA